jgi:fatty acid-binding protein DegV
VIRRFFAALADNQSPIRRALGPTAAFLAVALGVQYLQSTADGESRIVVLRRAQNESLKRAFDEAHTVFVAMHKAIDHPSDAEAQAAVPDAAAVEQLSESLAESFDDEDQAAGDVVAPTPPTAS